MKVRLHVIALACLALAGCGQVHELHYLRGNFSVHAQDGVPLDMVYVAPEIESIRGKTLWVEVAETTATIRGESKIYDKIDWPRWRQDYANVLAVQMWQANVFSDVCSMFDPEPIAKPDLALKVAITEWHEGNAWLRFLLGFGLGATRVQWEGAILDVKTDKVYFAFADARAHPGGPNVIGIGGSNAINGTRLIAKDLHWASDDLRSAVRTLTQTTEAERPASQPRPKRRSP